MDHVGLAGVPELPAMLGFGKLVGLPQWRQFIARAECAYFAFEFGVELVDRQDVLLILG